MTNPYPVDSATRHCCGGIGAHTRDCLLATVIHPWADHNGQPVRPFVGSVWEPTPGVRVAVEGVQTLTGTTREGVVEGIDGRGLTADDMRAIGAAFLAAADEVAVAREDGLSLGT